MPSSFAPVIDQNVNSIVLGSMPGVVSLQQQKYYAHAKNAFWRIAASYLNFDFDLPYAMRLEKLLAAGVGLWDVVGYCEREGSLDSAIVSKSVVVNDFEALLERYANIDTIYFNGRKAEQLFTKRCKSKIAKLTSMPRLIALPSTSPAYAAMPYSEKRRQWSVVYAN